MIPLVFLVVAGLTGVPLVGDVGGYLERSAEAEFAGEQLVSCETPDGSRTAVFDIAQVEGTVMAWAADGDAPIVTLGPGTSAIIDGDEVAVASVEGSEDDDIDTFQVGERADVTYLGRPAREVALMRDGSERVLLTVDAATDAIVRTRTYDGEGNLYCDRRMLTFESGPGGVELPEMAGEQSTTAPLDEAPTVLPPEIAGFVLRDTYPLGEGTMSYYSDGYFSLGVVVTSRPFVVVGGDDTVTVESGTGSYQRTFQAGSVTVTWESHPGNLAVMGDLPPDLLDSVLDELPSPMAEGFLGRLWSRLFG